MPNEAAETMAEMIQHGLNAMKRTLKTASDSERISDGP